MYDDPDFVFSPSGTYYPPSYRDFDGYVDYIKQLPTYPEPEVYGFHDNAAITKNQNATNAALATMLITQQSAGGAGGGAGDDALLDKLADALLAEVPEKYDTRKAEKKFPVSYEQSMNTVLTQELDRFNGLIGTIRSSLQNLKKAMKGEVLQSADLEAALNSLKDGRVPAMWLARSYPSLKSLGGYTKDLFERLQWFEEWSTSCIPDVMWITRFFFTQGFITGAKQNFARKYNIAIDLLDYDFEVLRVADEDAVAPEDGVHVTGMYLEGCRWDRDTYSLAECEPKVMFTKCPMVWFKPCKPCDFSKSQTYDAPIYKTSERRGVLMTTGHSTNHVLDLRLPTIPKPGHWIQRGAAILCALTN
jgi:dynein heavy chain